MKARHIYNTLLMLMLILGASCSSSRKVQMTETFGGLSSEDFIQEVIHQTPDWSVFSARTSLSLYAQSGKRTKVRGLLSIKRDEAIRLSVAPLLGIEFFRIEITPAYILVVDRMNKRYMKTRLEELSGLINMQVSYHAFQSLFLNEMFLPDRQSLSEADYKKFRVSMQSGKTVIQPVRSRKVGLAFHANPTNGILEKTSMSVMHFSLNWNYGEFSSVGQKMFPHLMSISSEGIPSAPSVELSLSGISVDGKWNESTKIPSRYREVTLAELIHIFIKPTNR